MFSRELFQHSTPSVEALATSSTRRSTRASLTHRLGPARDDPYVTQCRWIAGPSFFSLCAAADRLLALVFRSVGDVVSPLWTGVIPVAANPRRAMLPP